MVFDRIIDFLSNLTLSEIISYIVGIVGILITYVGYLRSKRTQKPKYYIRSISLKSEEFKNTNIDIKKGDRSLPNLTISRVALWNTGLTLNRKDIAQLDPIRVEISGESEILDVQSLYSKNQNGIKWVIEKDHKSIRINLDYLSNNQGIVLKVFHTGNDSSDLTIKGSLKNGLNISRVYPMFNIFRFLRRYAHVLTVSVLRKLYGIAFIVLGLISVVASIYKYYQSTASEQIQVNNPNDTIIILVLYGILLILMGVKFCRRIMPANLESVFYSER